MMPPPLAWIAAASLLISPGAWVSFGPSWPLSFAARLALAGALSPLVVVAQFFLLRLSGVPYETTVWAIAAMNVGGLWMMRRRWTREGHRLPAPDRSTYWNAGVFLVLLVAIAVPWFIDHTIRIFNFHAWLHAAIANQFAGGRLIPEEPELAGMRLAYPWLGHVYWSVLSGVAQWPHTRVYVATDIACLAWTCIAVYEACRALDVRAATARLGLVWLTLGTNAVGFWLWMTTGWLPGDVRYTPWLRKFMISELTPFILAMLAGLMLTGVVAVRRRSRALLVLVALMTASVGVFYALLLPAALAFSGALLLVTWLDPTLGDTRERRWSAVVLAVGLGVAVVLSATYLGLVTSARSGAPVALSPLGAIVSKAGTGVIAIVPFAAAMLLGLRSQWRRPEVIVLTLAAAACFAARPLVQMGGYAEYKFMLPTPLFLTPLAALAADRWNPRRLSMDAVVLASVVLLLPGLTARSTDWLTEVLEVLPAVQESGPSLVLGAEAPDAGWTTAVRVGTPVDTVVAVRRSRLLLPVLTERALLGPAEQVDGAAPGYWELSHFNLVDLRGYPRDVVDQRTALVQQVFGTGAATPPEVVLSGLRALGRPVALVFRPDDDRTYLDWLRQQGTGRELYRDPPGVVVWQID